MDDLISRQAAINALEIEKTYSTAFLDGYAKTDSFEKYNMGLVDGIKAIKRLSSAQPRQTCEYWDSESNFCALCRPSAQQWIPVSSGELPEANEIDEKGFIKAYLVQDGRWMDVARWNGDVWIAWGYGTVVKDVTAWMPLPKPWEGEV